MIEADDPLDPRAIADGKHKPTLVAGAVQSLRADAWELAVLAMQSDRFRTDEAFRAATLRVLERLDDGSLLPKLRMGFQR